LFGGKPQRSVDSSWTDALKQVANDAVGHMGNLCSEGPRRMQELNGQKAGSGLVCDPLPRTSGEGTIFELVPTWRCARGCQVRSSTLEPRPNN
jgi:hypothetical protein